MGDARTEELAARIADGQPVDWDGALSRTTDEMETRLVRQLRLVESIARVHRSEENDRSDPTVVAATTPALPGTKRTWGRLELRELLGSGGLGEVYRAWDPRLERDVALKLLKPGSRRHPTAPAATTAIEEGRLLAKLRHPNIVTVFGAEEHDGRVGLWMELIRGQSLEQLLRERGTFGPHEAALIGVDLCRALAAAHRARVLHRDVKADNAMREEGGRILLTDFGAGIDDQDESRPSLTGTPLYMAPELLADGTASPRSDIYSLGVLLYHLVTGSYPIEARSWTELREKHAHRDMRLLRDERPDLPEAFIRAVQKSLAWEPDARFETAGRMEQALNVALGAEKELSPAGASESTGRLRRPQVIAIAGLLTIAVALAVIFLGPARLFPPAAGTGAREAQGEGGAATGPAVLEQGEPEGGIPPAVDGAGGDTSPESGVAGTPLTQAGDPMAAGYTIEATLYRIPAGSTVPERVSPDTRLAIGDRLSLEFEASAPVHVYIINEDDAGRAYALFPLPGFEPRNPLPPGARHALPGVRDGKSLAWTVDSTGGRERLLILASPDRLIEFEAEMNALARPGQTAVAIPESARARLRGMGGLSEIQPPAGKEAPAGRLFEMAERLAGGSEMVRGVWVRRIDFENPARE